MFIYINIYNTVIFIKYILDNNFEARNKIKIYIYACA